MKPRLLIVGATGFVGSRWAMAAESEFDVVRGSRKPVAADSLAIDITDPASVRAAFESVRPDVVTHLAALSDIDRCERERELAERINYQGTLHVARECARTGARLLYTSTDAVFDGTRGIYYEHDPPTPPNWYGHTKALAERAIVDLLPSAAIVRLSLVLGTSALAGGNSYLEKVIGNLRAGNPIISPTYEFRNPIDVGTLCEFLRELTSHRDAAGIFHVGASDKMSRFDIARSIARRLGCDEALIVAQQAPVPGRAPRGRDDFLVTDRVRALCRTSVPTCGQVIERAVAQVSSARPSHRDCLDSNSQSTKPPARMGAGGFAVCASLCAGRDTTVGAVSFARRPVHTTCHDCTRNQVELNSSTTTARAVAELGSCTKVASTALASRSTMLTANITWKLTYRVPPSETDQPSLAAMAAPARIEARPPTMPANPVPAAMNIVRFSRGEFLIMKPLLAIAMPAFKNASIMKIGASTRKATVGSAGQSEQADHVDALEGGAQHEHGALAETFGPLAQLVRQHGAADPGDGPQQQHVEQVHAHVLEQVHADERRADHGGQVPEAGIEDEAAKISLAERTGQRVPQLSVRARDARAGSSTRTNSRMSATPSTAPSAMMPANAARTSTPL